jgi:S1-C subfamily serine protease
MMPRTRRTAIGTGTPLLALVALAACSVVPVPPSALPEQWAPSVTPSAVPSDEADSPLGLDAEQRSAVRIRNVACDGLSTGSGFILDDHTIVTNHHVVDPAGQLEVTLSDGTDVAVASSRYATNADFALITTVESLDPPASLSSTNAATGDSITVVGYPNGDRLVESEGSITTLDYDTLDNAPFVFITTAYATHGSSGSAVYNDAGDVIGVLYAGDDETGETAVIPVSLLSEFLNSEVLQVENEVECTPDILK